ncbi:DNA repair metallo-beta-lactamase [Ceratobasidium theobromae]|uniref:Protein artemis n=1 Tax=Ceratobasidium theobromae TaxID=1582974 RepID=A0A5N5Q819_9AGAM|nr:DNA repair metallo-beta-lactamase [Ceratobasidium theobromae]
MLLLLESVDDRVNYDKGLIPNKKRTFAALKRNGARRRDLLLTIPLNKPTKLDIGPSEVATITLLDANHCPGSVMYTLFPFPARRHLTTAVGYRFLIEGRRGAILHTGDIRAEPAMVARLTKSQHVGPYIIDSNGRQGKQLEALYLDTASMIGTRIVPSKAEAVEGLLRLINMYPQHTMFYINAWTWGYEDILIGIAHHFNTKVHVDRFKYIVLSSLSEYTTSPAFTTHPQFGSFKDILTCDEAATRFHACERFNQCETVKITNPEPNRRRTHRESMIKPEPVKKVVHINPGVITADKWETYILDVSEQLQGGEFIDTLRIPLSRHSTLTELQSFVAALRPKNIYPNTLVPHLDGLDWACLPGIFAQCLTPDGYETLRRSTLDGLRARFSGIDLSPDGMKKRAQHVLRKVGHPDLEQDNAIGTTGEAEWSEARVENAEKTREHIETFLPWLFGRQDSMDPAAQQGTTLGDSLSTRSTVLPNSESLRASCTNHSTHHPKLKDSPPVPKSTGEQVVQEPPLETDPLVHLVSIHAPNPTTLHQRNDQLYSPPPESPPRSRPRKSSLPSKRSMPTEWDKQSSKRPRQAPITMAPQNLNHTAETLGSPSKLVARLGSNQTSLGICAGLSSSEPQKPGIKSVQGASAVSNTTPVISDKSALLVLVSDPGSQTEMLSPGRSLAESPEAISRPMNTIPTTGHILPPTPKQAVPLFESDKRERRRLSKLKERDIRAQLAKLPQEFSRALIATKTLPQNPPAPPIAGLQGVGFSKTFQPKETEPKG